MNNSNKNTYTEARKRAIKRHHEKLERIELRVKKGKKDIIKVHAKKQGESTNAFVNRAVDEAIERDNLKDS